MPILHKSKKADVSVLQRIALFSKYMDKEFD